MRIRRDRAAGHVAGARVAFQITGTLAVAGLLIAAISLSGCSSSKPNPFAGKASPMYKGLGPLPKGGGRYHIGNPYQVAGETYYPREDKNYDRVGIASWYGPSFHRRMTSNGEWFDQEYLSAAHPTLPLPSYARVTNLVNRRSIVVRINDRGPFVADRVIDLSKRSADALGFRGKGTAKVRVTYLGVAPLNDKGSHLAAMNRDAASATQVAAIEPPARQVNYTGRHVQPAAAPVEGYFVQVAAYSDPDNAGRARSRLAGLGPVTVTPVEAGMGTFYRVRVGPLADLDEASSALDRVREAGHADAKLIGSHN